MKTRVNIGCGRTPTEGWVNFDNSPAIALANSPLQYNISKLLGLLNESQIENIEWIRKNKIYFADASKKIPLEDSTVECIYSSHMLEHLSQNGASVFLREALRVLEDDGILRIAVPDLRIIVNHYLDSGDADRFMRKIGVQAPSISTLRDKLQLFVSGYRHHQWMYDGNSLSKLMLASEFRNVRVCKKGDTLIKNPGDLGLYERSELSVYVEGIK